MGVEPTIRSAKERITGFEGRESHRTLFASKFILAVKQRTYGHTNSLESPELAPVLLECRLRFWKRHGVSSKSTSARTFGSSPVLCGQAVPQCGRAEHRSVAACSQNSVGNRATGNYLFFAARTAGTNQCALTSSVSPAASWRGR